MRRNILLAILSIVVIAILTLVIYRDRGRVQYVNWRGYAQGGDYNITCSVGKSVDMEALRNAVNDTLQAIDKSVSGYNKGSILSRWNRGEDVALDSIFITLFKISEEVWRESDGAFDPSAAPLFDVWKFGFEDASSNRDRIPEILKSVGMDKLKMVERGGNTYLERENADSKINFNAIAQGYSCDVVAHLLESYGCENYLVEIGGEIICKGASHRGTPWRVWIDKPLDGNMQEGIHKQDIVTLTNCGLVTSGNYRKFYEIDGEKYSHTIDPHTGEPVKHTLLCATVVMGDGIKDEKGVIYNSATADAYATWFMTIGLAKTQIEVSKIASTGRSVEAYLVYGEQDKMRVWFTPGLTLDSQK